MNVVEDGGVGLNSVPRVHALGSPSIALVVPWLLSRERLPRLRISCCMFGVDLYVIVVDEQDEVVLAFVVVGGVLVVGDVDVDLLLLIQHLKVACRSTRCTGRCAPCPLPV